MASKRDLIGRALYRLKRNNKDFQHIYVSNLIKDGLRVSIELGGGLSIDVTRLKCGNIKSQLIQRYFVKSGKLGGFNVQMEDEAKRQTKEIPGDYNSIQKRIIDTIKNA